MAKSYPLGVRRGLQQATGALITRTLLFNRKKKTKQNKKQIDKNKAYFFFSNLPCDPSVLLESLFLRDRQSNYHPSQALAKPASELLI